jgi:hypothetical protein
MMKNRATAAELLERDFVEHRAGLLELAAFLDRLERSEDGDRIREDFRYRALLEMLRVIGSGSGKRAEDILLLLSDPSAAAGPDVIPPGRAVGAWRGIG